MRTTPEQRAEDLKQWRVLDPNCEHRTHAYLLDIDTLESRCAWQAEMLERAKPFVEYCIREHGDVWGECRTFLSDLAKGPEGGGG